jgi:Fe-S-cluster-containing dehydrogenase component
MSFQLYVDLDRCFGCFTCEVACKQEHDLPVGPRWIRVIQDGPKEISKGRLQLDFYPAICKHCPEPTCVKVCPERAIVKRPDGIVLINQDHCTGCKICVESCPFGLMDYERSSGKASKCTLCVERLSLGLQPSCVTLCPGKALILGKELRNPLRIKQLV